jgi:hypothetical protein
MQTSWIAGGVFVGFVVYITIKGELPAYRDAIFGGQDKAAPAATNESSISPGWVNPDPSVR